MAAAVRVPDSVTLLSQCQRLRFGAAAEAGPCQPRCSPAQLERADVPAEEARRHVYPPLRTTSGFGDVIDATSKTTLFILFHFKPALTIEFILQHGTFVVLR